MRRWSTASVVTMILAISPLPFWFLTLNLAPVTEGPLKAGLNLLSAALIFGRCAGQAAKSNPLRRAAKLSPRLRVMSTWKPTGFPGPACDGDAAWRGLLCDREGREALARLCS